LTAGHSQDILFLLEVFPEPLLSTDFAFAPPRFWSLVMNHGNSFCLQRRDWKTLYRAAILETNKSIVPERASEAEKAILARGREILYGDSTAEEKELLEDMLYVLHALKTTCQHAEAA
jgi:hypothetical protein